MLSQSHSLSRIVLATLSVLLAEAAQGAQAAGPTSDELARMPAGMRAQVVKDLVARQAADHRQKSAEIDSKPPVVKALSVDSSVNADATNNQVKVTLRVVDDLSGLSYMYVSATSPSGKQRIDTNVNGLLGIKSFSGDISIHMGPFSEAGNWLISDVYGQDVNGNYFSCNSTCLGALGDNHFMVNSSTVDNVAPALVGGTIITPRVSLSKPAKGTEYHMPFLITDVQATDAGLSGVSSITLFFCDMVIINRCIYTFADSRGIYGLTDLSMSARGPLYEGQATGTFELSTVVVKDFAGNESYYNSTKFGGTTDFKNYFPSTKITLVP